MGAYHYGRIVGKGGARSNYEPGKGKNQTKNVT